jgi:large subunit ribosomal protein L10
MRYLRSCSHDRRFADANNASAPTEDALCLCGAPLVIVERLLDGERPMPTAKKAAEIEALRERLAASPNLFLTDFSGLSVAETSRLRNALRKDGATYTVVKNSLFSIAAGAEIAKRLETYLAGPTAVVFTPGDPAASAKALSAFAAETKKLEVKAGFIEGEVLDAATVGVLATLPSRLELLTRLVSTLAGPMRGLVTVLSGNQRGLVRVLDQIRQQKLASS